MEFNIMTTIRTIVQEYNGEFIKFQLVVSITLSCGTLLSVMTNKAQRCINLCVKHYDINTVQYIVLYCGLWLYLWSLCLTSWQSRQVSWSQVSQNSFSVSCLWMSQNIGLCVDTPWTSAEGQKVLYLRYCTSHNLSHPPAWVLGRFLQVTCQTNFKGQ